MEKAGATPKRRKEDNPTFRPCVQVTELDKKVEEIDVHIDSINTRLDKGAEKIKKIDVLIWFSMLVGIITEIIFGVSK